ncbi:hypothetical protein ACLH2P_18295 [Klebsiella michiganensis]
MMVENDTSSVEYQLSTSTGPFDIPFYFIENGHIVAELYTQNGDDFNKTTLTVDVDYYLNGAGDKDGGQLTLLSAHSGATLLIYRDPDATQLTSYQATGKFPATSHERALDKLTMLIQKFGWWWDSLALKKPNIFANYYDALNNRIRNLRDPSQAQDAATKNYVDSADNGLQQQIASNFKRSLRVPDSSINQLPSAEERAWKGLGFDGAGQPKLQDPAGTGLWGYVPAIGSFEKGSLLTQRFEVLLWESTDEYWRWDGAMPKIVLPGSTPDTAGGRGKGKWLDVTDATLRSNLGSGEEGFGDALVAHRRRTVRERLDDEVSVLDFGSADQFGTAMMAAMDFVMSEGGGTIFVPGRSYTLDTTIIKTLTADIHIRMSKGADVAVKSPMDVYNLNTGDYQFVVEGGKTTVSLSALGVDLAVFRITGRTLQQTCKVDGHTLRKTGSNNIGYFVYASGANAPEFVRNQISAASVAYHLESSTENSSSGLIANAMEADITGNKIYNCSVAVEIVNKGYYGCEGVIIAFNKFVCSDTAIKVIADASLRSAYMPPLMQVISNHLNAYKAISAQKISRLFFSKNDIQSKFRADDSVNGMIELYSCQGWSVVDNEFSAVSQDGTGRINTNTPIFLGELDSVLPNAYGTVSNNTFWLDGMTAKAIDLSSSSAYTGQRIKYGINNLQSLNAITARAYGSKLKISEGNTLSTYDAAEGLAYSSSDANYGFDSTNGILYIKGAAPARDLHIISTNVVPNGAVINQIVAENIFGRQLVIQFAAAEVTLTHGKNLIAPDQKTTKMWLPTFVVAEFLNNQQCRIVSISGIAARHVISNPAPGATGSVGDQYFDPESGNWKVYMPNGTFRVIATTPNT